MPCVARLAAQMFGRLPLRKLPPDEAVAMAEAMQFADHSDVELERLQSERAMESKRQVRAARERLSGAEPAN